MSNWVWVELSVILALHEEHLAEHGGKAGLRDRGLLESAVSRPFDKASYANADAATLAAAYAFAISSNHPFVDGNKRSALVAAELFLELNGYALDATDTDCVTTFLGLAAGDVGEERMGQWFRDNIRPLPPG